MILSNLRKLLINIINYTERLYYWKYASKIMISAILALEEIGVLYYVSFGTLLGIIREGELLKHDLDIDITILPESYLYKEQITAKLISSGFNHLRNSIVEDRIVTQTFIKKKVKLDIWYNFNKNEYTVCYSLFRYRYKEYDKDEYSIIEYQFDRIDRLTKKSYRDYMIAIPSNFEAVLNSNYGETWRVVDKTRKEFYPNTTILNFTGKKKIINKS